MAGHGMPYSASQVCLIRKSDSGGPEGTHDVELNYDTFGKPTHPAVLLIMGLTCQKIRFPSEFCKNLASAGFRVIRFDNRDVGRSAVKVKSRFQVLRSLAMVLWAGYFRLLKERRKQFFVVWVLFFMRAWHRDRLKNRAPRLLVWLASLWIAGWYRPKISHTVADQAGDTLALMNALQIQDAHLVGYSMGGMISQYIAHHNPERVSSVSLISTCSPNAKLTVKPGLWPLLRIAMKGAKAFIPGSPKRLRTQGTRDLWMYISAPGQDEIQNELAMQEHSRSSQGLDGLLRQALSIFDFCSGDDNWPSPKPEAESTRALVIHGLIDNLLPVSHGFELAKRMNCKCVVLPSVSHDSFPAGQDDILDELKAHLCKPTSAERLVS